MKTNSLLTMLGGFFAVLGILHLFRLLFGWKAFIGAVELPVWLSGVAVVFAAYVVFECFRNRTGRMN